MKKKLLCIIPGIYCLRNEMIFDLTELSFIFSTVEFFSVSIPFIFTFEKDERGNVKDVYFKQELRDEEIIISFLQSYCHEKNCHNYNYSKPPCLLSGECANA